jgi:acetyltransferase-like isoleucine patch superfamily enzyme
MSTALQVAASVSLSGDVFIDEPSRLFAGCALSNSHIGAFSYVSPGASLHSVTVGRYCSIGDGVQILSQHPHGSLTTSPFVYQRVFAAPFDAEPLHGYARVLPTKIGNDVWIGSGAKIKSGITIGDGAVIGAGAVLTRDVVPYSIVGGVPAEVIRNRFSEELIAQIRHLAWWQYNLVGLPLDWQDPQAAMDEIVGHIRAGALQAYHAKTYKIWIEAGKVLAKLFDRETDPNAGGISAA